MENEEKKKCGGFKPTPIIKKEIVINIDSVVINVNVDDSFEPKNFQEELKKRMLKAIKETDTKM